MSARSTKGARTQEKGGTCRMKTHESSPLALPYDAHNFDPRPSSNTTQCHLLPFLTSYLLRPTRVGCCRIDRVSCRRESRGEGGK